MPSKRPMLNTMPCAFQDISSAGTATCNQFLGTSITKSSSMAGSRWWTPWPSMETRAAAKGWWAHCDVSHSRGGCSSLALGSGNGLLQLLLLLAHCLQLCGPVSLNHLQTIQTYACRNCINEFWSPYAATQDSLKATEVRQVCPQSHSNMLQAPKP